MQGDEGEVRSGGGNKMLKRCGGWKTGGLEKGDGGRVAG